MASKTTKPTDTLSRLSNEILTAIASHIDDRTSLGNFIKTSRICRSNAEPTLYQDISHICDTEAPRKQTIYHFLRTLLRRPDLALRVKKYQGDIGRLSADDSLIESQNAMSFEESDWIRIMATAKTICSETESLSLVEDFKQGQWDTALTLILSLMSNLQELSLLGWGAETPTLDKYLERASESQKTSTTGEYLIDPAFCLSNTRKIFLAWDDTESGMDIQVLEPWMKLKSIRDVTGFMISCGDGWSSPTSQLPECPQMIGEGIYHHIERLTLSNSSVDADELAILLRNFTSLKQFEYEYAGPMVGDADFQPPKILRAICAVRASLEELSLSGTGCLSEELENYPFGSFKDFPKLKILKADGNSVTGSVLMRGATAHGYPAYIPMVSALPPNIERFCLANPGKEEISELVSVLEQIHQFPTLKLLDLGWESGMFWTGYGLGVPPFNDHDFDVVKLKRLCADAGIKIR